MYDRDMTDCRVVCRVVADSYLSHSSHLRRSGGVCGFNGQTDRGAAKTSGAMLFGAQMSFRDLVNRTIFLPSQSTRTKSPTGPSKNNAHGH